MLDFAFQELLQSFWKLHVICRNNFMISGVYKLLIFTGYENFTKCNNDWPFKFFQMIFFTVCLFTGLACVVITSFCMSCIFSQWMSKMSIFRKMQAKKSIISLTRCCMLHRESRKKKVNETKWGGKWNRTKRKDYRPWIKVHKTKCSTRKIKSRLENTVVRFN